MDEEHLPPRETAILRQMRDFERTMRFVAPDAAPQGLSMDGVIARVRDPIRGGEVNEGLVVEAVARLLAWGFIETLEPPAGRQKVGGKGGRPEYATVKREGTPTT